MTLLKRSSKFSILVLSEILLAACGNTNSLPPGITTPETTTLPIPASVTPVIHQLAPLSTSTTTFSATNEFRLYHNHIATRTTRDQYSFSIVVMDPAVDLTPISIQIVEQGSGVVIGQYKLFNQTEIDSLCASSLQNPDFKIFETVLIDYFDLPQGFMIHAYEGDFIFQITIEHRSGVQEIVEMQTPARSCYQAVS